MPTKANPAPTIYEFSEHLQQEEVKQRQEKIEELFHINKNSDEQTQAVKY